MDFKKNIAGSEYQSPKINQAQTNTLTNDNNNQTNNYISNAKVAQFHKTRMCLNMTNCPRQSRCNYAHSVSELRSNLNLSRTKVCKAFQQGKCRKVASQCNFAHGLKELVSTFGYFKTKECPDRSLGCHKGVYCRNFHTEHERLMAEKFISSQGDQSVGSVKHVEFYNFWSQKDPEGLDSFLKFNETQLQNSNSYYRRYRGDRGGDYGSPTVDNSTPSYPSIPRPAPLPDAESGPELAPGRLNYAKIASASVQPSSKVTKPETKEKVDVYGSGTDQINPPIDANQTHKDGIKGRTPMRVTHSNYSGGQKYGSIDYGVGSYHQPQYGYFLPPGFIPGMGSMQGFGGPVAPNAAAAATNVAALNKLNSLNSFNSFGSFGGHPDSASNSGPFTHFQPMPGYGMMPRDFSSSMHCSSSGNFQWPRSQGTTQATTDLNDSNSPNQATITMNDHKINQNPPSSNKEH